MRKDENRINTKLKTLRMRNEKALVCFLTAGFPAIKDTVPLVLEIEKGGADIIELGMPFSDPLADGPVIQASSQQAIKNGITLEIILKQVKEIRKQSEIPIVLMGYLNPILAYGVKEFFNEASKAGVDGVILPELPFEESGRYQSIIHQHGIVNILLITPTTPSGRIAQIDEASNGFLYCVSTTGVTGKSNIGDIGLYLSRIKRNASHPILVGFGIKTPADAKRVSKNADGIIIGSVLISKSISGESPKQIGKFVQQFKKAL